MNFLPKKSTMVLLTVYVSLWLLISIVAGNILNSYESVINTALGLTGYRIETITTEGEDLEYFKSKYVKKDENGNIIYVTDENGYTHQLYDDAALKAAGLKTADQVQREGTTILWNSDDNGLPLAKGNKVSLFSHSTVDWVYCGASSGRAWTKGASDVKKAFTNAGLKINTTLWDFYKSGAGKDYTRTEKTTINEVPWSKYTDSVKNSFASYGDAAIIVISRKGGEGYANPVGTDNTSTLADTPSGDYFDLSKEERDMIREVVALKNAGTFKKVVVILNTPNDIWFDVLFDYKDDIDSCMWVCSTGFEGLDEVGRILVGESVPSGHLVDTFLQNTCSNPVFANTLANTYSNANSMSLTNLGYQGTYITYAEGIYLGYKYYETRYEDSVMGRGNATSTTGAVNSASNWVYGEEVAFPFGYGMAYTSFRYSNYNVSLNDDGDYVVTVTVTNIGNYRGADAVQVYVQKPYTEYDKTYGVEQASVNLAGYAKTHEMNPGESVTVTITVRDDAFKTYDANNAKTYIREAGDYYIAVGHDAHDAVNNILAAKGYTPENTNGVMDASGNTKMVEKISFTDDDFETYSKSEITGVAITNQFDDTDWNKYANKTDATITYLSRSDWEATYPTSVVVLSMNDKMVADLAYDKIPDADPNDKMPLFGQEHVFNLVDLKGVEFDSPLWDTLLDQLTLDDIAKLLGTAYHGTKEIASIAKPAELTKDGPMGVRIQYLNSSDYALSFPSNTLLAASFNDQLALAVGEIIGEDMMHAGITGIYGVGSNIHRSSYSARNFEYYSEDGFISGMMAKYETIGIQSTGCYVNIKHVVLNDQETNRHGICTWANEQSIREIYLPVIEYAVQEADCGALMSGFNRLGTSWSGAHKGLMTNVLREEWGFEGFVISDCAWQLYMGVIGGVMAGNDCVLDNIDLNYYKVAENNATVAKAMRESAHRILYVIANTNAMNGLSSNTRIYEVDEWWQELIVQVQQGLAIAAVILLILTILRLLLPSGDGDPNPIVTVISLIVSVAVAVVCIAVPVYLNQLPMDFMVEDTVEPDDQNPEEPPKPSLKEQLGGEYLTYKFEAECADINASNEKTQATLQGTVAGSNYPSGDLYIHHLESSDSLKVTFNVTASEANKAVLSVCMGRREYAVKLSDMWKIKVNGVECSLEPTLEFSVFNSGSPKYYDWVEMEVALVDLQAGNNVIEFEAASAYSAKLNFDYIALTTGATLQDTREVGIGHSFKAWTIITEPTFETAGSVCSRCSTCREYVEEELPVISESNGYTKTVISNIEGSSFVTAKWTYTINGNVTFEFIKTSNAETTATYKFEAEKAVLCGSAKLVSNVLDAASGSGYVGEFNNNSASITLYIESDRDCEAMLLMGFGCRTDKAIKMNDGRTLTVNGNVIDISDEVVFTKSVNGPNWYDWHEFEVVLIKLSKGNNVISLSNASKEFSNIDYFSFVTSGVLSWGETTHDCESVCDKCGKCFDLDCALENCLAKCQGHEDGHDHSYEPTSVTAPTCNEDGYTTYTCSCGKSYTESIKATGHSWTNGVCSGCGAMKIEANVDIGINNPFLAINGGSVTGSAILSDGKKNDGYYYEKNYGATFTVTLVADKDTEISFIIKFTGGAANLPANGVFSSVTLNGSTDGVVRSTEPVNGNNAWNVKDALYYTLATISLKEGVNNITFTRSDDTSYNINICGIVVQTSGDANVAVGTRTYEVGGNDPFTDKNGGSVSGDTVSKNNHATNGVFYQNTQGATFTTSVIASNATEASFVIKFTGSIETSLPTILKSLTLNGQAVDINDVSIKLDSWNVKDGVNVTVATLSLKEGKNVISFTMGQENVNIAGISFIAYNNIYIGNSFNVYDEDLFSGANGTHGTSDLKTNHRGTFYQNTQGATFTTSVTSSAATETSFILKLTGDATVDISSILASLTINGKAVQINEGSVKIGSWDVSACVDVVVATISLNEGTNTISFTMGQHNLNVIGIEFGVPADVVVALGSAE